MDELVQVVVIEFVTVAMAFDDLGFPVCRIDFRAFLQGARVSSQPHRAAFFGHALLFFHQVDHRMRRAVHLGRIRIGVSEYVAGEFDYAALHSKADPEERDFLFAGVTHRFDFAFDAAVPETGRYQNAAHAFQLRGDVLFGDLFRIYVLQFHLRMVCGPGVYERFDDRFVGVGQFGVFAD